MNLIFYNIKSESILFLPWIHSFSFEWSFTLWTYILQNFTQTLLIWSIGQFILYWVTLYSHYKESKVTPLTRYAAVGPPLVPTAFQNCGQKRHSLYQCNTKCTNYIYKYCLLKSCML